METCGLQASIQKSKGSVQQAKNLVCVVTANGHSPDPKKIQGLVAMKDSKNKRQERTFIGGANFYRKMWSNRSNVLEPLTELSRNVTLA